MNEMAYFKDGAFRSTVSPASGGECRNWSLAGFAFSLIIRLGSNLLMTRLLVPEMFGVMAIASTVTVGLAMFSDVGLKQNIVQSKRGSEPTFLNTAWAIQILRGVLIWSVALCLCFVILVAGRLGKFPADSVYAAPSLPYVIAVLSISAVIAGFELTKLSEASRGIQLGRITGIEILAQVSGLVCMLAWVTVDRSIWALVAGSLCSSLSRTVLSHAVLPGIGNRWQWDGEAVHEVLHFGKWILISSVLGFLVNSGDRLLWEDSSMQVCSDTTPLPRCLLARSKGSWERSWETFHFRHSARSSELKLQI